MKPYLTNHDARVKSAAANCVSSLASRYAPLVSTVEVEYLIQLSLRQIHASANNDETISSFSLLIATCAAAVLDPTIVLQGTRGLIISKINLQNYVILWA